MEKCLLPGTMRAKEKIKSRNLSYAGSGTKPLSLLSTPSVLNLEWRLRVQTPFATLCCKVLSLKPSSSSSFLGEAQGDLYWEVQRGVIP